MIAVMIVVAVLVVVGAAVIYALRARGPQPDDGVATFQRHLDALSPAARRQVIDRVKKGDS